MKKKFLRYLSLVMVIITMMSTFAIDVVAAKKSEELATPKVSISLISTPAIKISWSKVNDADMYYVYRRTTSKGSLKLYAKTEKLYYKDTDVKENGKYYYKVKAVSLNSKGKVIKRSDTSKMVSKTVVNLKAPTLTVKTVSDSQINLSWNKVDEADRYYMYYSTSKNGTYKSIGYVTSDKTSYTLSNLNSFTKYYFKVKAAKVSDGKVYKSGYSTVKSAKTNGKNGEFIVEFEKISNEEVGLPTGSAMTCLAMLMQFYSGKKVDPNDLVPYFNCTTDFYEKNGKLCGPDPSIHFIGDPTSEKAYGNGTDFSTISRAWKKYSDDVYGKRLNEVKYGIESYNPNSVTKYLAEGNIMMADICYNPNYERFWWLVEPEYNVFKDNGHKYVIVCGYTDSGEYIVYAPDSGKYEYYPSYPGTYNTINVSLTFKK